MNPYSFLDTSTLGYLGQAGIDPSAVSAPAPQQAAPMQYPTYPNAAGVGSQTAGTQPVVAATNKLEIPDVNTRGMSPYSLLGDANYRQR